MELAEMELAEMEMIWFFQLPFRWTYDSTYNSGYGSDSVTLLLVKTSLKNYSNSGDTKYLECHGTQS